ncbi:nuclear transport factor 2 family protein [Nocardia sp. NEAU-G5]|uniref:Nuclear transport factor 2 family protein n=1 Tax=Nocardia albiluteola TaxID=2842303 RepID=A0ABS6B8Y1_9NOCA|nr:nuclear transport factor 2 family protein [Nocardia albiluteola]MBU3065860.1 nuclear transport factor 2 family protein [Nocardia albiluteola]
MLWNETRPPVGAHRLSVRHEANRAELTALIADYLELMWNRGRTDLAARFVACGLVEHCPSLPDGRRALVDLIHGVRQRFPDARFELRRIAADGDLVFAHSLFTTGPGDRGVAVADVFRIDYGLIVEHWQVRERVPEVTVGTHPVI